jgi:N-methylhydantoinase A
MAVAIRVVSVERGYDPRDFALLAFGGAGPLHACDLAEEMGMRTVIIPPYPGVLCALGLLVSDLRVDRSLTRRLSLGGVTPATLREIFTGIENDLRATAAVRSRPDAAWTRNLALDMRYLGQSYELQVPIAEEMLGDGGLEALAAALDAEHQRVYGFATPGTEKEIVCFRVTLEAPAGLQGTTLPPLALNGTGEPETRAVFFKATGWVETCPVYQRDALPPGRVIPGPAVIEQMDSTVLVIPAFAAAVDDRTNLILSRKMP